MEPVIYHTENETKSAPGCWNVIEVELNENGEQTWFAYVVLLHIENRKHPVHHVIFERLHCVGKLSKNLHDLKSTISSEHFRRKTAKKPKLSPKWDSEKNC